MVAMVRFPSHLTPELRSSALEWSVSYTTEPGWPRSRRGPSSGLERRASATGSQPVERQGAAGIQTWHHTQGREASDVEMSEATGAGGGTRTHDLLIANLDLGRSTLGQDGLPRHEPWELR